MSRARELLQRWPAGRFALALAREFDADDLGGMAAEMAYRFLFALVPSLLFVVTLFGFVGPALGVEGVTSRLLEQSRTVLPSDIHQVLVRYVDTLLREAGSGALLTLGAAGALWGASGGIGALIKGLNRAYDVGTPRALWHHHALAVAAALVVPLFMLAMIVLASLSQALATWLADAMGMGEPLAALLVALQLPVFGIVFALLLSLAYYALPNVRQRYVEVLPGSLLATVGFVVLAQAFGLFTRSLPSEVTVGAISAAFAFLLWLDLAATLLLLGAEVNSLLLPGNRARWLADSTRRGGR
ncbi:MAG: YihY/virulence factor BrkB family protein [Chloroflexi bacterium]|nr:YihY/virulence factor BrkB family protein [Chloroflexota bacterium]